jgi:serine phosphatase RsbU (regulator of sigma subunit)
VHPENPRSSHEHLSNSDLQAAIADEVSRKIQRGLLPPEAPRIPGFDIAAGTRLGEESPGRTVWDFFQLKDGRAGLVSLHVQGEGLPPGLFLALARALLRELGRDQDDLQGLLARLNSGLASVSMDKVDQYVQAGILLPSEGGVEWAGAGACPGAVIRRTGVFQEFSAHGPPLGMMEGFLYGTERMELGAGDSVLVLSDVPKGVFRGAADLVASLQGKPAGDIVSKLHRALAKARPDGDLEASVLFIRRQ